MIVPPFNFSRHSIAVRSSKRTSPFVAFSDSRAGPRRKSELRLSLPVSYCRHDTPNAALLAQIGTILMTALLVWAPVLTFLNVLRDLVRAVTLFQSFIYALDSLAFGWRDSPRSPSDGIWLPGAGSGRPGRFRGCRHP
jgi:hypothetical protein